MAGLMNVSAPGLGRDDWDSQHSMKELMLFALVAVALAGADTGNRYCGPGDMPKFGARDGPAALPERCINTTPDATPSPGETVHVAAGENPEMALQRAACGDTILLQAGGLYRHFTIPAKPCDANHWITIRTSAPDLDLPEADTRLTPCYAGVASLPGRPSYDCPVAKNRLARIELKNGAGAITFANGANHYRLVGLEVTRTPGTGLTYALVRFGDNVDHVVIDRCWIHGTAADETVRGIYLGGSRYVGIVNSYFSDFHCIAITGACTDAQAINGGNSTVPVGVYKIVNNYLEGAAENLMFGGAPGSQVPADIEVRRNHMFKPLSWLSGRADFIGQKFIVKNLFELKNGVRVLVEGNVMENSWGGFTQVGYGILLTPRGSWAAVEDVTIRYNLLRHTGSGMQLAATRGDDGDSLSAQRWSIHDDLLQDIDAAAYDGDGIVFQISSGFRRNTPLNQLSIDHLTVSTKGRIKSLLIVGAESENPRLPFEIRFTNNIVPAGRYSVWSTGIGTCPKSGQPLTTFKSCWKPSAITNNVIIDYPREQGPWPAGNWLAKDRATVGFADVQGTESIDDRLSPNSSYKGKGSDGRDPGADIGTIIEAIAGVR